MIEAKLAIRNLKRDFTIYSLMIFSSALFIALIVGFQSTIESGALGEMLGQKELSEARYFFKVVLNSIAVVQYIILIFFISSYYRILNKKRIRELALYKIIGYTRGSIKKIMVAESALLFSITVPIALGLAVVLNQLIILFVNYYLEVKKALVSELSISSFIITCLVLLIIIGLNTIKTYRNSLDVDLELALSEGAIQKKIEFAPKYCVFINLIAGLILLIAMTYVSFIATLGLRYGVIITAVFYAFGLFLLINAFAKGYRYLISEKRKKRGFNRLLAAESNFQLNKSRVVTLSSIILIMMSLGSLLLSQAISISFAQEVGNADFFYNGFEYNISNASFTTEWVDEEGQGVYSVMLYPLEFAEVLGIDESIKPYQIEVPSQYSDSFQAGEKLTYSTDEKDIEFTVSAVNNDQIIGPRAFIPYADISGLKEFLSYQDFYNKHQILHQEVADGNLNMSVVNFYPVFQEDEDMSVTFISLTDFNNYLQLIGKKPVTLSDNQIIIDGGILDEYKDYQIADETYEGLNAIVVSDKTLKSFDVTDYDKNPAMYFYAKDEANRTRIIKAVSDIDLGTAGGVYDLAEMRAVSLGSTALLLLIALYLAIIFVITNFTIVTINILSHGIENRQLYLKLEQMGIKNREKSKYISSFIRTISTFPLIVGVISGIIATRFAIFLVLLSRDKMFESYGLLLTILGTYTIIYIIYMMLLKFVYNKIIS